MHYCEEEVRSDDWITNGSKALLANSNITIIVG